MRISDYVLYSDNQLIALCKPPGMPTQDDATGDASLHRIAQAYCKHDLYVVHRLDRPVSGVVVFAKNKKAAAHLSEQFASGNVRKKYLALIPGGLQPVSGQLEHALFRDERGITRMAAENEEGQHSVLQYRIVRELDNYALIEISPLTGRTHQIRAQMSIAGYPIKGDVKYGSKRGNKDRSIHLHCASIELGHPTKGDDVCFACPVPEEPLWQMATQDLPETP